MGGALFGLACSVVFGAITAVAPSAALAQDLITKPALETADASWTGTHIGGGVGASLSDTPWTTDCLAPLALPDSCPNDFFGGATRIGNDNPVAFDSTAPRLSAYLGADWQLARFVVGIEGDGAWSDADSSHSGIPGTWSTDFGPGLNSSRIESAWDASMRVRAGFLLTPTLLVYSTGGLALLGQEVSVSCEGAFPEGWCITHHEESQTAILTGWTLGGGIEKMLTPDWVLRAEYRYSDYGTRSYIFFEDEPLDSVGVTIGNKVSSAYVGLSRRF